MGSETKIEWTHHTFNPWRGCTKVSPGCVNCYAEVQSKRNPKVLGVWGRDGTRSVASESYWNQPLAWNREAEAAGERRRVFCSSLADVFEWWDTIPFASHDDVARARARLFRLIDATPHLDWLLLTKRPERIADLWHSGPTAARFRRNNVWLGTSVEDQARAGERIPHILSCRDLASVLFLSCEPLLGPLDLGSQLQALDWVIAGGESGAGSRVCQVEWVRDLTKQCRNAGVSCFVKQLGRKAECDGGLLQLADKKGGDAEEWPADLRIREFPK